MMFEIIELLKKHISTLLIDVDKEIILRSRKISFKDIFYCSCLVIGNNYSYEIANSKLKLNGIINTSTFSLIKYKNNIDSYFFKKIIEKILPFIFDSNENRIIAVDGTNIFLFQSLVNEGFKISTNGNYCTALISTLFDVEKEIPINYKLTTNDSEREVLVKQLKYLNKNDVLIADRGYYSKELLYKLFNLGIKPIFRLKKNMKVLSEMHNENDIITFIEYNGTNIKFRIIKYFIDDACYYLGTTIFDHNADYFKNLYWKRWKIEINFRYSKYNLSMNNIKSKTKNGILQDIYIHNFIFTISAYLQFHLQKNINVSYKINSTVHLNLIINDFFKLLFYKKATKENINKMFEVLNVSKQSLVPIRPGRKYERTKKKPSSKWCQYGNKYKMAKK